MNKFEKGKDLYQKAGKIGKILINITKIMIGIIGVMFLVNIGEFILLKLGSEVSLDFILMLQSVIGILYIVGLIVSGVTFLIWFYRSLKSLRLLGVKTRYTTPWFFWGWIVPVSNLIIPFKIMEDICKGTSVIKKGDLKLFKKERTKHYYTVQFWRIARLVSVILGRYVGSDAFNYETIQERINNYRVMGLSDMFDLLEQIFFIIILVRINKLQINNIEKGQINKLQSNDNIDNHEDKK